MNLESFWSCVDIKGPDDCWLYKGATGDFAVEERGGYGKVNIEGKTRSAHHVAFQLSRGRLPQKGLNICHKCDVRACCNPNHLFEGTAQQNTKDAATKLRLVHKLSPEQARIARAAKPGEFTELARIFGVSKQAISFIARGKNWKYLDEAIDV